MLHNSAHSRPAILLTTFLLTLSGCSAHMSDAVYVSPRTEVFGKPVKIDITEVRPGGILLDSNVAALSGLELVSDGEDCFKSPGVQPNLIRVCRTAAVMSVHADLSDFGNSPTPFSFSTVLLRSAANEGAPEIGSTPVRAGATPIKPLEIPRPYSLDELRRRAREMNFDAKLQFQQLITAKANMRMHYLNLLPHLSMNTVLTVATSVPFIGWIGAIGDLAPFLLPSRWFQAAEASHLKKAEDFGLRIMQEDAVQLTEGLAFQVAASSRNLEVLKAVQVYAEKALQLTKEVVAPGKIAANRPLDIEVESNDLQELRIALEQSHIADLAEISYASGFTNPSAVSAITVSPPLDLKHAPQINLNSDLTTAVISTSLELSQMNETVFGAQSESNGRAFEWLDPSADPQAGVGFGLPSYMQVGQSTVKELEIQRQQIYAGLLKKMAEAVNDYQMQLKTYTQANTSRLLELNRIQRAMLELKQGESETPIGVLQDAISQLLTETSNMNSSEFGVYNADARIHRLLHTGIYACATCGAQRQSF